MTLNWHDLTYLIELDRSGSVKKAAQRLGTSHQTVARRLRSLERALGLRLIDDSGQNWVLTAKGKAIRRQALQMEDVAGELVRSARTEADDFAGRIGVSSAAWGMELIVLPALRAVRTKHPGIAFDLVSEYQPTSVQAGAVDVALRFTNAPPQDLIGKEIGPIELGAFGHAPIIEALDQGQLPEVPVVRLAGTDVHADAIGKLNLNIGTVTTVSDPQTLLHALRQGFGIGIVPRIVAAEYGELVASRTIPMGAPRAAWLLRHQDSRYSNTVRVVEEEILKFGRNFLGR